MIICWHYLEKNRHRIFSCLKCRYLKYCTHDILPIIINLSFSDSFSSAYYLPVQVRYIRFCQFRKCLFNWFPNKSVIINPKNGIRCRVGSGKD